MLYTFKKTLGNVIGNAFAAFYFHFAIVFIAFQDFSMNQRARSSLENTDTISETTTEECSFHPTLLDPAKTSLQKTGTEKRLTATP